MHHAFQREIYIVFIFDEHNTYNRQKSNEEFVILQIKESNMKNGKVYSKSPMYQINICSFTCQENLDNLIVTD